MSGDTSVPAAGDLASNAIPAALGLEASALGAGIPTHHTPVLFGTRKTKTPTWSDEEKKVVNKYKEQYLALNTPLEKAQLLKDKVMPDIWNYWNLAKTTPTVPADSQARFQKLKKFCQNNWRPQGKKASSAHLKVLPRDVVRKTMEAEVDKELEAMLGSDGPEQGTVQYFAKKKLAVSKVLENLTQAERHKVDQTAAEWSRKGYPPANQRRMAEKTGRAKVEKTDRERWLQMGMTSLTFAMYIGSDGLWKLRVHDTIAENMGVVWQSFTAMFKDIVQEMKFKLLHYVRSLHETLIPDPLNIGGPALEVMPRPDLQIKSGKGGFPELPTITKDQLTKIELVLLLRTYWAMHYNLASGRSQTRVPFTAVKQNVAEFIAAEYLPKNATFEIQDPQNMRKEHIVELLQFWKAREESHGVDAAFRWSAYVKKGVRLPAEYAARHDVTARIAATKSKRQKRKKGEGKKTTTPADALRDGNPSAATQQPEDGAAASGPGPRPRASSTQQFAGPNPDKDTHVLIDQEQMQQLNQNGYPAVSPLNGPGDVGVDGPIYSIPLGDFEKFLSLPGHMQAAGEIAVGGPRLMLVPNASPPTIFLAAAAGLPARDLGTSTLGAVEEQLMPPPASQLPALDPMPLPMPPPPVQVASAGLPWPTMRPATSAPPRPLRPLPPQAPVALQDFPLPVVGSLEVNQSQIQPIPRNIRQHVQAVNAALAPALPPPAPYSAATTSANPDGDSPLVTFSTAGPRKQKALGPHGKSLPERHKKETAKERREREAANNPRWMVTRSANRRKA